MKTDARLYISPQSYSVQNTPTIDAQRLPFYVHSCGHFDALEGYYTIREGLDNYLILFTLSGEGFLKYRGGEYCLRQGTAVLFHCLEPQEYGTAGAQGWDLLYLHFNGTSAGEYFTLLNGNNLEVISLVEPEAFLWRFDELLADQRTDDFMRDIRYCNTVSNILTDMLAAKRSIAGLPSGGRRQDIDKVMEYMQSNLDRALTLDELAAYINISKYHFTRIFKEHTQQSPYEYLTGCRIRAAKSMLRETDFTLQHICTATGFGDINNFIRCFKRLTGTTPANYRRNWL